MADYNTIIDMVYELLGDGGKGIYTTNQVNACLATSLSRYSAVIESVETRIVQLAGAGLYGQKITWPTATLNAVSYLHWPAAATVPGTTTQNKILDWWYYRKDDGYIYVDLQIEGATNPALNDYMMVSGVLNHSIDGFTYLGTAGTTTSVARHHWSVLVLGAAAYALRSAEGIRAVSAGVVPVEYKSAYHVNVLAGLADAMLQDFDAELKKIGEKRLERPPWGFPERKRMRRILSE